MNYTSLLKCIADPLRLRILNILAEGPLCVCHIQEVLDASQVRISKQLAVIKQLALIDCEREGTWMIYRLCEPVDGLLTANLAYLRRTDAEPADTLLSDLGTRERLLTKIEKEPAGCPAPVSERLRCC